MGGTRSISVVALAAVTVVALATGVLAHGGATVAVPVVDAISPSLPQDVTFEILSTQVATLVELSNPTDELLEVVGPDGAPWLRISAAGVAVQAAAIETYATTSPSGGAVPGDVLAGERPSSWVPVTDEPTWAWFEHRLHPEGVALPASVAPGADRLVPLLDWELPVTYAGSDHVIAGRLVVRRPTGSITASMVGDPVAGVDVQVLSGALPGVLLRLDGASEAVVIGLSGEEYLRFTAAGVEVDTGSPTHRAVEAARGADLSALADDGWRPVAATASYAWLEVRGRAPVDVPEEVRTGGVPVDLVRWQVPLVVDGEPQLVEGVTRWEPIAAAADAGRVPAAAVAVAAAVALVLALVVRWRRRGA